MDNITDKQPFFKKENGEDVLVVDMTTPELVKAQSFCKGYVKHCLRKLRDSEREHTIMDKKLVRTRKLLTYIKEEIINRRVVLGDSKVETGDRIIVEGDDNIYEISESDDLKKLENLIKSGKVLKYN